MNKRAALLLCFACLFPLTASAAQKPAKIQEAPDFPRGKNVWLNTKKLSPKFFDKKVTLVYFWDYTSINCLREMKLLKRWYEIYQPHGFQMVWVHAPEFPFAASRENVEAAVKRLQVSYPVYLDNDFKLWDKYKARSWPMKALVDPGKKIVYTHTGEGGYIDTETEIREQIKKLRPKDALPAPAIQSERESFDAEKCGSMTPETYVGYKRADWWGGKLANRQWAEKDREVMYKDRGERVDRGFFAQGLWSNTEDDFTHMRQTDDPQDYIGMIYNAREVYTVLRRKGGKGEVTIYVQRDDEPVPPDFRGKDIQEDAQGRTYFLLKEPRLYYLIANEDELDHEIKLIVSAKGVAVNSFSFSNNCLSDFDHL